MTTDKSFFTPVTNRPTSQFSQRFVDPTFFGKSDPRQPLPVLFPVVRERFLNSRFNFWVPNEIPMGEDNAQFLDGKLTDDEYRMFKYNISYLSVGDNLIPDNIITTLMPRITAPEVRQLLRWIIAEEANHIESYLFILESLGIDTKGQGEIFDLYRSEEILAKKVNWNIEYSRNLEMGLDSNDPKFYKSLIENLTAYYMFEYIFFPAGFSQIFALSRNGKLRNTAQQYSFIWRDETQHSHNALFMLQHILNYEFGKNVMDDIIKKAIKDVILEGTELEIEHAKHVIGNGIEGYSIKDYESYVKFLTNQLCQNLGMEPMYKGTRENPIPWINTYQLEAETNFFEGRVREYKTGNSLKFNKW